MPLIFWTLVISACTWGSWVFVSGQERIVEDSIQTNNELVDEIPPVIVDQPILEEVSLDGAVRWTLYLDRIIRAEGSVMELAKPRALYRFQSGEILEVTGQSGTYDEEAGILILSGGVTGTSRNSRLEFMTDELLWDSVQGLMTATGGVEITREGLLFHGQGLRLDFSEQFSRLVVSGGVEVMSNESFFEEIADTGEDL